MSENNFNNKDMNNSNTSRGFQTIRDTRENKIVETGKFANVSKIKPKNFLHHLHKAIIKKKSTTFRIYIICHQQM